MQAAADAAASLDADERTFWRIAETIGELRTQQTTYISLASLENMGLPVFQILGKVIGKPSAQTRQLSQDNHWKPPGAALAVIDGFAATFKGRAAEELRKNGKVPSRQ